MENFHYLLPQSCSPESVYACEYLANKLMNLYPDRWESLLKDYSFYGESLLSGHHIFKFKGDLCAIEEEDGYIEVPFSEEYKCNPAIACLPVT